MNLTPGSLAVLVLFACFVVMVTAMTINIGWYGPLREPPLWLEKMFFWSVLVGVWVVVLCVFAEAWKAVQK